MSRHESLKILNEMLDKLHENKNVIHMNKDYYTRVSAQIDIIIEAINNIKHDKNFLNH